MRLKRSIPFFTTLLKAPSVNRSAILHAFPIFVVDDLVEILYNIVMGTALLGKKKEIHLKKHKRPLLKLVDVKSKRERRVHIYKQKGGFIGSLIPLVISTLLNI
jgi:hypothetical protein